MLLCQPMNYAGNISVYFITVIHTLSVVFSLFCVQPLPPSLLLLSLHFKCKLWTDRRKRKEEGEHKHTTPA